MIKFDTRDKKPKLYNILFASVIAAAAVSVLMLTGAEQNNLAICVLLDVWLASVLIMLVSAFFKQLRYNPYSYNTIFYLGFSLFVLSALITHIVLTFRIMLEPGLHGPASSISLLASSARNYMMISAPFVLIFSVALCVSNVSLIKHEGKRPVNFIGILLSFFLVGGEAFIFLFDFSASGSALEVMAHDIATNVMAGVYLYFECMLIGAMTAEIIAARYNPDPDRDFVIILGCGIRKDGTPTPVLRGRIDRAIAFCNMQKEKTGRAPVIITSGGKGTDETLSESACMRNYLLEQGIPEEQIVMEDRSTTTMENMIFSKEKIKEINPDGKIAFSTSDFHVFRSGIFARRVKMRATGMGAKTKWYFWPNASVREFVCLITAHKLKQAIIFTSIILIYVMLTVLAYNM